MVRQLRLVLLMLDHQALTEEWDHEVSRDLATGLPQLLLASCDWLLSGVIA